MTKLKTLSVNLSDITDYFVWFFQDHGDVITNLKLQKLLYYAQGWSLALYGKPLHEEGFEAWVHGPVVPIVYHKLKKFTFGPILNKTKNPELTTTLKRHLNEIIDVYGAFSAFQLEYMTHQTDPWKAARGNIPIDAPSKSIISQESMKTYFKRKMQENARKNKAASDFRKFARQAEWVFH